MLDSVGQSNEHTYPECPTCERFAALSVEAEKAHDWTRVAEVTDAFAVHLKVITQLNAPSSCAVCADFAKRLADLFVSRDASSYVELKSALATHQNAEHADWWVPRDGR